jgi:hypothetical protein
MIESALQSTLDPCGQRRDARLWGKEEDIAALDISLNLSESRLFKTVAECGHRDHGFASHVDPAEEG